MTRPLLQELASARGPLTNAMNSIPPERPTSSTPNGSENERAIFCPVSSMPSKVVSVTQVNKDSPSFQCPKHAPFLRKCVRPQHLEWLRDVAAVTEPITRGRLCAALGWRDFEAKRSLGELSARGYLVATPGGHFWSDDARAELAHLLGRRSA